MAIVEKMYGVTHGGSFEVFGITTARYEVHPSIELIREIKALPEGTSIGIETFDPNEFSGKKIVIGVEDRFPKEYGIAAIDYWDEILAVCQKADLPVNFLDDFPTWKSSLEKRHEVQKVLKSSERKSRRDRSTVSVQQDRAVQLAIYKMLTEADYLFHIEREDRIIENIVRYSPQVVVLGLTHGDYMFQSPEDMQRRGLEIQRYKREEVESGSLYWSVLNGYNGPATSTLEESPPDPKVIAEREAIVRRYRAVGQGRVVTDATPNFIGTWNMNCPPRGLFEVYIEGDSFRGKIEDTEGTASFGGQLTDTEVRFIKNYDPDFSTTDSIKEPLVYQGRLVNGQYEGTFGSREQAYGRFTMRKFS